MISDRGLNIRKLASISYIKIPTLYTYVNGLRIPRPEQFLKICSALRLNETEREKLARIAYKEPMADSIVKNHSGKKIILNDQAVSDYKVKAVGDTASISYKVKISNISQPQVLESIIKNSKDKKSRDAALECLIELLRK